MNIFFRTKYYNKYMKRYRTFTIEQIKNSKRLLLVVNGKVYDVTYYINSHPGGKNCILYFCNKNEDALCVQNLKFHSEYAINNILKSCFVGYFIL